MGTSRYLCVHGHFYQPPREDPSTGVVPVERNAAPFHDFNEKILAECYRPNAQLGNFDRLSFDLGPTLGEWMRKTHPDVLDKIAESDRRAVAGTGHGNAIMQSYHHTILPLASERDRRTELRWGVRWFEHTFGRRPRGIWLPETAVDTATLEACAAEGLTFTILSPEQAANPVDTRLPYRVALPSGASFVVLFYEGPLSGTVSFDASATNSAGEFFRRSVAPRFEGLAPGDSDPIVTIASDGEVYGHHHRFKDYFLRDLLFVRAPNEGVTVTSLERFLALVPAVELANLRERSSWGCAHHLLRWSGDCACTPGDGTWKHALRAAFDRLAERIDRLTEERLGEVADDVWELRDGYVDVVIGATSFVAWLAARGFPTEGVVASDVETLMEAQRWRLAMYASCAFYWDDLTRIEAGYGVRSALHAAALLDRAFGTSLQAEFAAELAGVVGWRSTKSAAQLYIAAGS